MAGMYHYTESGLNGVWLLSGYEEHETPKGKPFPSSIGMAFTE